MTKSDVKFRLPSHKQKLFVFTVVIQLLALNSVSSRGLRFMVYKQSFIFLLAMLDI